MTAVPCAGSTSDAALMASIATGDLAALGELYQRYRADVRRFVLRATRRHDDTEDMLHDTFLVAARIAAKYDGRASCRPWLIGIAARLVQQRAQRIARVTRYLSRLARLRDGVRNPLPELEARSSLNALDRRLDRMSAGKRIVLVMAEVEGLTCPEIADALDIPIGTVWTRLHHARRELLAQGDPR
jgi:RNA polymerase sigma-70 factor (ECF subfamily)